MEDWNNGRLESLLYGFHYSIIPNNVDNKIDKFIKTTKCYIIAKLI